MGEESIPTKNKGWRNMDQSIANYIIGPHMSTFTQSPDAVSIPNKKTWGSMKTQSSQVGIPMFASQQGQSRLDRPGASASLRAVHHAQRWTDFFMKCDKHIKSTRDGEQLPGLKP
jgi:hypothetical protein